MQQKLKKVHFIICIFSNLLACCASVDPTTCCKMGFQYQIGPLWDCRRCGLQSVPPNPPAQAKAVSLRSNAIKKIPKGSLKNYGNVEWLNLGNNSLTLQPGTAYFEDLPKLKHLFLLRNPICLTNLSEQNPDIFKPLGDNLIHINMYRIEYNEIDDRHFEEYPGKYLAPLRELYIATLPAVPLDKFGNYFINLTKIHYLSFLGNMPGARNLWTIMKNETFVNMPYFKYITLTDSAIKIIEPYAFQPLPNLRAIETFCSSFQAISLLNAIENLPKATLETLIFEYDKSLADVPRNKTFQALSKLTKVVMSIPFMVPHPNPFMLPHPNPFMLDLLPIFWESVTELEIIRPYTNSNVSTLFHNPHHPRGSSLYIKVSNGLESIPDHAICIMTGTDTRVIHEEPDTYPTKHYYSDFSKSVIVESAARRHVLSAEDYGYPNKTTKPESINVISQECDFGSFSKSLRYRLLSLTLAFYISHSQFYEADLLIQKAAFFGINTELVCLTINQFENNVLPEDLLLQNLEVFNISSAGLYDLDSRNMPRLAKYDISNNNIQDLCHTDALSRLHSLEIFNASNNDLNCLSQISFLNAPNLTHVDLSQNTLQTVSIDISHLKQLQLIDLSKNQIQYFPRNFMDQICNNSVLHIDLSGNSLVCYCGPEHISFISWMISHPKIFEGFENYTCWDIHGNIKWIKELEISAYEKACKSKLPIYIAVTVSGGLAAIIIMSLGYQHRWRIMWYAYNIKTCFRSRKRKQGRRRQMGYEPINGGLQTGENYDIFLAYAQENSGIMSPVLERLIPLGFSVGHPDGFEWGKSMFEESLIAIQQSEKTVFLVTKAFAQCRICNFQLQMALINGKENIVLLQMDSMSELNSAGMEPVLCRLLQSDGTLEYCDNECFWQTFKTKLRS